MKTIQETHQMMIEASKQGWHILEERLECNANREIVDVKFEVIYDELGHDIILQADIKVVEPETFLLQSWLKDMHPGIWIPEYRPWVASAVEYTASQRVTSALCGLFDSKWRPEDSGSRIWRWLGAMLNKEAPYYSLVLFRKSLSIRNDDFSRLRQPERGYSLMGSLMREDLSGDSITLQQHGPFAYD